MGDNSVEENAEPDDLLRALRQGQAVKSYGQIGYEAYFDQRGGKTFGGSPMPFWKDVDPEIKEAWEVAARAITKEFSTARESGSYLRWAD